MSTSRATPAPPSPETAARLLEHARRARAQAYAPYSRFPVGAALLTEDGSVVPGCNVENASFSLTNCAERVALGSAIAQGRRGFQAIAVVGPEDDVATAPCGSCRQALFEFAPELWVVMPGSDAPRVVPLRELLPGAFDAQRLEEGARP